jgi:hypothetical protein
MQIKYIKTSVRANKSIANLEMVLLLKIFTGIREADTKNSPTRQ